MGRGRGKIVYFSEEGSETRRSLGKGRGDRPITLNGDLISYIPSSEGERSRKNIVLDQERRMVTKTERKNPIGMGEKASRVRGNYNP